MYIDVGDAKIFSAGFGSPAAPALVGIGGWVGSWELWTLPFAELSADWHTIGYDHRGCGATVADPASITLDRLVQDVFAVLDAYGVERCFLAAESAGAATAIRAAVSQPQRIAGLVIVDGAYFSEADERDPFLLGLQSDYASTLDWFVDACIPEPHCEHLKRWGRQILDRAAPAAAIALYRTTNPLDLQSELGRLSQPTLILHGEDDRILPVASAHRLAQLVPHAQLTTFPGTGHVPTMTRPHEVAREIARFLRS